MDLSHDVQASADLSGHFGRQSLIPLGINLSDVGPRVPEYYLSCFEPEPLSNFSAHRMA